jgi:DNA polymerase III sliding clamp (beta) subunit (PCNA family)
MGASLTLNVRELADEVSTVASLDTDSLGRVRLSAEGDQLLIESAGDKGRVASAVTIEELEGALPSLALSSTYAARALKSASMISERAELGANVSTSPIVLTPTALADKVVSARFVVVPMRS